MATQVGRLDRHDRVVAGTGRDGAVAVGAEVGLVGLVRLEKPNLHLAVRLRVVHQSGLSTEKGPEHEEHGDEQTGADEEDIGRTPAVWPRGVHSHEVSIVGPMRTATLCLALVVWAVAAACAGSPPDVPLGPDGQPDEVLGIGRDVWGARCANCHGSSGGGGTGPRLAGTVVDRFADPADQEAVVRDGRDNMPAFGGTLSDAETEAVVRYTREVLS